MWVTKLLISPVKKKDFLPKNDQIWPKIGILGHFGPGLAGSFGALLVGWLVVVARGLYLARHLLTLSQTKVKDEPKKNHGQLTLTCVCVGREGGGGINPYSRPFHKKIMYSTANINTLTQIQNFHN